ncbi:hypothetical protein PGTUg99_019286 [Puccinia graminis f. sp. tritici]|uniref:Uncharacterized protein n=1 Tax=Puccinia graminis f. sp. tritici TaxID=56615 RepID=A0A5B0S2T0_PUCGR|nr:hypothetical protein PGTUg99_036439 [Puccinia graminis f. sp. tritici]KAA1135230.1 hypothetical protein PGTUg99_019286 [Puccinia graminis f. sp. tritici]
MHTLGPFETFIFIFIFIQLHQKIQGTTSNSPFTHFFSSSSSRFSSSFFSFLLISSSSRIFQSIIHQSLHHLSNYSFHSSCNYSYTTSNQHIDSSILIKIF